MGTQDPRGSPGVDLGDPETCLLPNKRFVGFSLHKFFRKPPLYDPPMETIVYDYEQGSWGALFKSSSFFPLSRIVDIRFVLLFYQSVPVLLEKSSEPKTSF